MQFNPLPQNRVVFCIAIRIRLLFGIRSTVCRCHRAFRDALESMSEQIISDKFIKLYYSNLAYAPEKLEIIYGPDSVAKFHDTDSVALFCGRYP